MNMGRVIFAAVFFSFLIPFTIVSAIRNRNPYELAGLISLYLFIGVCLYFGQSPDLASWKVYVIVGTPILGVAAALFLLLKRIVVTNSFVDRLEFPTSPNSQQMRGWCTKYLRRRGWRVRSALDTDVQIIKEGCKSFFLKFAVGGQMVSYAEIRALGEAAYRRKDRVVIVAFEQPHTDVVNLAAETRIRVIHYKELAALEAL